MATAETNRTIWNLAIIGILGFLAWKLWPTIRKQLNMGGSGGGGAVGPGSAYPGYPYQGGSQQQPGGSSAGFQFPKSSDSSGGGIGSFLQNLLNAGTYAGSTPGQQDYIDSMLGGAQIDANANWTPEIENLDLNSPDLNFSYDDPNAPWNSGSDGSDTADYGPDTTSVDLGLLDTSGYGDGGGDFFGGGDFGGGGGGAPGY